MTVLVVTGTDTGVGKTVATAALACHARQVGIDVAVCKPVQTGTDDGDLAEVARLSGVTELAGLARYPRPLAPVAAAAAAGMALPSREQLLRFIDELDQPGRLTLVEGAGGLLVELGENGVTTRDLAVALSAAVLVVVRPALGTLNHTALTLEALAARGLSCAGLVIGTWPEHPGPVETSNRSALEALAPVRAVLPAGAAALSAGTFEAVSAGAFDRDWVTALAG
ncbi:dethiobiotin synthetase [Mycobacterium lepraemurium]|nr:dethiobiotin synthase [Mycobacterium lepraemurium]ATA28842.1 dethiobiotin synthetase [Mycobacterium lepraemurium]